MSQPLPPADVDSTDATSPRRPLSLAALVPNHRDLYVLAAGLLLGLLLGPAVLGRLSPETYNHYFADLKTATEQMAAHDERVRITKEKLVSTDVTSVALSEFNEMEASKNLPYLEHFARAQHTRGRLLAAMLAVLVVMILETLPAAEAIVLRSRLATARYALMALVLALLMAQPQWIQGLSLPFLLLLVAVGLAVALVPLSKGQAAA